MLAPSEILVIFFKVWVSVSVTHIWKIWGSQTTQPRENWVGSGLIAMGTELEQMWQWRQSDTELSYNFSEVSKYCFKASMEHIKASNYMLLKILFIFIYHFQFRYYLPLYWYVIFSYGILV